MKYIRFIAFFILSVYVNQSYSQNINYKDLIGTWDKADSKKGKVTFKFLDSSNLKIINAEGDVSKATFTLSGAGKLVKMTIESNIEGINSANQYFIKLLDSKRLMLESLNTYDPVVQVKPVETTLLFTKRKS